MSDTVRDTPRRIVADWWERGHQTGRIDFDELLDALAAASPAPVTCLGYCGTLDWTLREYGVITHKHDCPRRTTTFCQSHRDGCAASPAPDRGLDDLIDEMSETWVSVERAIWPHGPAHGSGSGVYSALKARIIAALAAASPDRGLDALVGAARNHEVMHSGGHLPRCQLCRAVRALEAEGGREGR